MPAPLELSLCVQLACQWEATARKAGNVHPAADFPNLQYLDFLHSSAALGPAFAEAQEVSVGATVLRAIQATRRVVASNTNLGIVLLLAPLAKVPRDEDLTAGVEAVLSALTVEDARLIYQAIAIACPGGMGKVEDQDVAQAPTLSLREVMRLAQDRDLVARQYSLGFSEVFAMMPRFLEDIESHQSMESAIVSTHLRWMATYPDSLIQRKAGALLAEESQRRAKDVLDADWPRTSRGRDLFRTFDAWLRADGNRRNPGTSADLTTACIFIALRDHKIQIPLTVAWAIEVSCSKGTSHG